MVLIKILKRKDASSVMLAVLIALIVWQPLMQEAAKPAAKLLGLSSSQYLAYTPPGGGWRAEYLYPVAIIIVQLVILEILGWIYVLAKSSTKK